MRIKMIEKVKKYTNICVGMDDSGKYADRWHVYVQNTKGQEVLIGCFESEEEANDTFVKLNEIVSKTNQGLKE